MSQAIQEEIFVNEQGNWKPEYRDATLDYEWMNQSQFPNRVGRWKFDPTKVGLFLAEKQKRAYCYLLLDPGETVTFLSEVKQQSVFGDGLLDFYVKNPQLIPEDWRGKTIAFWGRIYRGFDEGSFQSVRCLVVNKDGSCFAKELRFSWCGLTRNFSLVYAAVEIR